MSAETLRRELPATLPFAIRELLIGNVIMGNYTAAGALAIGHIIARRLTVSS